MWFDKQSKIVRILLLIPAWGWLTSGLYRFFRYGKSKNLVTLVVGILCLFAIPGFVVSLVDLITTALNDKIELLAD